jgi:biotin operon repressor
MKATGTAEELAERLGVSRSTVFEILNCMKNMGADIEYNDYKRSYYYTSDKELAIGFVPKDKIRGGIKFEKNIYSPIFSDWHFLPLQCYQL